MSETKTSNQDLRVQTPEMALHTFLGRLKQSSDAAVSRAATEYLEFLTKERRKK